MEEVLDVYEQPYDPAHPKVCLDESPRQLIGERRESYTDEHGIEHIDYEYTREGTADLYMVVEPLAGRREVLVKDQHTRLDWAEVVAHVVEEIYPTAKKITLVQDNLSAHKKSAFYELFEPERARAIVEKLEFVFTPKHGSWLNIAEIELSVLTRQGLKQRVASKEELERQATAWYEKRNGKMSKVDWQFTTKDARIKLKRLYPSIKP
jgi:transposase